LAQPFPASDIEIHHTLCAANNNILKTVAAAPPSLDFEINIRAVPSSNADKMHYPASFVSTPGAIGTYARNMTQTGKPGLDILVDGHRDGAVYTTFDSISGKVNITAPHASRFDEIRITFEGCTRTYVENISPHSSKQRTTATHNFLKLSMPIRDSDYPQPRIAEAGKTYTFPFNVSFYTAFVL